MNLILADANDHFPPMIMEWLRTVDPTNYLGFKLLVFDSGRKNINSNLYMSCYDYPYIKYAEINDQLFLKVESIITISLSTINSIYASHCFEKIQTKKNFYIFLTDDELERWSSNLQINGSFTEDVRAYIDRNVISLVAKVHSFLGSRSLLESYRGGNLETIFSPQVRFYEGTPIVSTLDSLSSKNFGMRKMFFDYKLFSNRNDTLSLLVFTKPSAPGGCIEVLRAFANVLNSKGSEVKARNIKLGLWVNLYKNLTQEEFNALSQINKLLKDRQVNFEVEFLNRSDPILYLLRVASYKFLIAQARGGFTTIYDFTELGGITLFREGTPNSNYWKSLNGTSSFTFQCFEDLLFSVLTKSSEINQSEVESGAIFIGNLKKMRKERFVHLFQSNT